MATATLKTAGQQMVSIPFESVLVPEDFNCRKDLGDLSVLIHDYKAGAPLPPLVVNRTGRGASIKYNLVSGFRRYAAISEIRKKRPTFQSMVIVSYLDNASDDELHLVNLQENLNREDLTEAEIADAVVALMKQFKMTRKQAAKKLGRPMQFINHACQFAKQAGEDLKEASKGGEIPNSAAVEASRLSKEGQSKVVQKVKGGKSPNKAIKDVKDEEGGHKPLSYLGRKAIKVQVQDVFEACEGGKIDDYGKAVVAGMARVCGFKGDPYGASWASVRSFLNKERLLPKK